MPRPAFRPYYLIRQLLFRMDAEKAHDLTLKLLKARRLAKLAYVRNRRLQTMVCGMEFENPVGLAAGFDKNAEVIDEMRKLGFGFIEVGSITPLPQDGTPQPRLFRVPSAKAIINRMGFNNKGLDFVLKEIIEWHDSHRQQTRGILGINLGKNKTQADAAADYVKGIDTFASYADYLAINISSPNTPGLRDLQSRDQLEGLVKKLIAVRNATRRKPPLFVKIAPDQTPGQLQDIAEIVIAAGVDGLIIGNTTITRPPEIPAHLAAEAGGLSGEPLRDLSTRMIAEMYKLTGGKLPIIGVGGIASGADAYAKIRAGASLVQLYTALVYEGPGVVKRILIELTDLLERDGFKEVGEAVGIDSKAV